MLLPLTPEARAGMVPFVESVTAAMAVRLGWRWNWEPPLSLAVLTVKAATEMQVWVVRPRAALPYHEDYISLLAGAFSNVCNGDFS